MLSNEIKKGDKGTMRGTGWEWECMDNARGNIRLMDVRGYAHEMGSVYVWDIGDITFHAGVPCFERIELTPAQVKARQRIESFFGALR